MHIVECGPYVLSLLLTHHAYGALGILSFGLVRAFSSKQTRTHETAVHTPLELTTTQLAYDTTNSQQDPPTTRPAYNTTRLQHDPPIIRSSHNRTRLHSTRLHTACPQHHSTTTRFAYDTTYQLHHSPTLRHGAGICRTSLAHQCSKQHGAVKSLQERKRLLSSATQKRAQAEESDHSVHHESPSRSRPLVLPAIHQSPTRMESRGSAQQQIPTWRPMDDVCYRWSRVLRQSSDLLEAAAEWP